MAGNAIYQVLDGVTAFHQGWLQDTNDFVEYVGGMNNLTRVTFVLGGSYSPNQYCVIGTTVYVCYVAVGPAALTPPNDPGHWAPWQLGAAPGGSGALGLLVVPGLTAALSPIPRGNMQLEFNLTGAGVVQALPSLASMAAYNHQILRFWKDDASAHTLTFTSVDGVLGFPVIPPLGTQGESITFEIDTVLGQYRLW